MDFRTMRRFRLLRDRRGFTRLEFGLLTAMLCAMVVNGLVTLSGGLASTSKPMGQAMQTDDIGPVAHIGRAVTTTP